MATCGPSNPLQDVKNHMSRDASLQNERVTAGPAPTRAATGFRRGPAEAQNTAAQFADFSRFGSPQLDFAPPPDAMAQFRQFPGFPGSPGMAPRVSESGSLAHREMSSTGAARGDWVSEFQKMSISHPVERQASPQALNIQQQSQFVPQHFVSPFSRLTPSSAHAYTPQTFTNQAQRASPCAFSPDAAFDDAFAAVERRLEASSATPPVMQQPQIQTDAAPDGRGEDLSEAARSILNTVHETATPKLANKMKDSKFMALMNKMSSEQVRTSGADLVDAQDKKIDAYAIATNNQPAIPEASAGEAEATSQDWVPQRPIGQQPAPGTSEDFILQERIRRFSRDLEDPDTYFRNMRERMSADMDRALRGVNSPFESAVDLGQLPLRHSDWEENYEDW